MSDDCVNTLHDYPLPRGYVSAAVEADDRLAAKWKNLKCPDCGLYGWRPPVGQVLTEPQEGQGDE